jgi:Fur family ferric uptake transcriptional regulator
MRQSNLSSPSNRLRFLAPPVIKTKTPLSKIEALCVDKGLRMTTQRSVIARVLSAATDHPDVEEVYRRANEVDRRISLSTVYRTVRLFETEGIINRHDFGDAGRARYERVKSEHHDHLIDTETGQVIEFKNEEIERLQERVARDLGYDLVGHKLELYGRPIGKKT